MKLIIRLRRLLILDVLFPDFIRHVSARRPPVGARPQLLTQYRFLSARYSVNLCELFPFKVQHADSGSADCSSFTIGKPHEGIDHAGKKFKRCHGAPETLH
jgi:hypothetical protein